MRYFAILFFTGVLLLVGCAGQTVRHLPGKVWVDETAQVITMRYLSFHYKTLPVGRGIRIRAEAYPNILNMPDWASWYGESTLSIYVADENGNVLAWQTHTFGPHPLKREASLPVEAMFDMGTNRDKPLYISFGYTLMLMDKLQETASAHKVLVTESALSH